MFLAHSLLSCLTISPPLSSPLSSPETPLTHLPSHTEQVDDWFTNYRRRGYPEHRHAFHAAARASAKAAYDSAVAEARRAAQVGSADALSAAEAEVARLAVLKDEADDRLAKAEAALAEHHAKISGRKQRDGDD